jgi:uncharacterized protein (TIGR02996 family)
VDAHFQSYIRKNPKDPMGRLVYADYLDENGREHEAAVHRAIAEPHSDERVDRLRQVFRDKPSAKHAAFLTSELKKATRRTLGTNLGRVGRRLFAMHHAEGAVAHSGMWSQAFHHHDQAASWLALPDSKSEKLGHLGRLHRAAASAYYHLMNQGDQS